MEYVLSELCEQVVAARAAQRPIQIRGGGTRLFYGGIPASDDPAGWLDLSGYCGVIDYEPSELVLTARAGTTLVEIESLLASKRQMLAFEPPRFGPAGTIGGCIASGMAGPRRMAAGKAADFVLGTRVLGADGHLLRFGGEVMKNVAGYDLSRLMCGSLGILGVLTEVSLKVVPQPRCERTAVLQLDEQAALDRCLSWRKQPLPVSATAWYADESGGGRLSVRLSGNESAVRQGLATIGGEPLEPDAAGRFWQSLRDQTGAFFQQRPLWRLSLPPKTPALDLGPTLHEWGGTLRWISGEQDAAALRARVSALGGSACLYRRGQVPAAVPAFQALAPALMQIHKRLKHEFDPAGIFNAGRLYPEF